MKAAVRIGAGLKVKAGDVLEHGPNGATRPQASPAIGPSSFARVLSPERLLASADGSYRVECEMLLQHRFSAHD